MIPEKKDLPGAKSGRSFFLFCIVLMPLSLSRGEDASAGHDEGGEEEGWREVLAEEKDGEQRADKWCEGVVGAGASGTDYALGIGVEIDTQTVRHKAQEQQDKHLLPRRKGIVLR